MATNKVRFNPNSAYRNNYIAEKNKIESFSGRELINKSNPQTNDNRDNKLKRKKLLLLFL